MASCCKSKSTCIMFTVNLLLMLVGLLITIVAGITHAHQSHLLENFPEAANIVPIAGTNVALGGGVILLVVSIIGLCGAANYEGCCGKLFLILYIFILLAVLIVEVVAVGILFALANRLGDFRSSSTNKYVNQFNGQVANFTEQVYDKCCMDSTADAQSDEGCKLIFELVSKSSCSSKDTFQNDLVAVFTHRMRVVGGVSIAVAIIQLFTFCASCCLLCRCADSNDKQRQHQDLEAQRNAQYYQPPAQPVAGVAQPGVASGAQISYA
eukprot:CAMPEP_0197666850 /NCGR_PEP_ID=MMETSP1338-20131121/64175_1 /TAXON_ID=43686 ORGANISM="Pelagodinium beii, Strain RCC1491" /NCGR_SAMPLE_ID=MMETSP1338 /ASSEMBLY_ACC=CAM_ASM_000754 /LENGTH=266 /DNA_ID=CAMNT_0043245963 /DNA_START=66 /DNA_END=866 /DNA_ORIENTATION=+